MSHFTTTEMQYMCSKWGIRDREVLLIEMALMEKLRAAKHQTEWLTCPRCGYKSPYSELKMGTLVEESARVHAHASAALAAKHLPADDTEGGAL